MELTDVHAISNNFSLITSAKKGDKEAFISLMEDNKIDMYRISKGILNNESDIEDAMQNTIMIVYEKLHTLKNNDFFKTWLIRILINECNNIYKKNKKTTSIDKVKENTTANKFANVDLYNALNSLDYKLRVVIVLFYFEDMTTKEIAKSIGISDTAVRTRLFRGREKLYNFLGRDYSNE